VEEGKKITTICKNDKICAHVLKKVATRFVNRNVDDNIDLHSHKSIDVEEEAKVVDKFLRFLLFCKKMKRLSLHQRPLKEQLYEMVCYTDLLRLIPHPSRTDDELKPQISKRLA
jgi:hypothetical protein